MTTFAVPGAQATLAAGINDRGQVAGTYYDPGFTIGDGNPPRRAPCTGSSASQAGGSPRSTCQPASTGPP